MPKRWKSKTFPGKSWVSLRNALPKIPRTRSKKNAPRPNGDNAEASPWPKHAAKHTRPITPPSSANRPSAGARARRSTPTARYWPNASTASRPTRLAYQRPANGCHGRLARGAPPLSYDAARLRAALLHVLAAAVPASLASLHRHRMRRSVRQPVTIPPLPGSRRQSPGGGALCLLIYRPEGRAGFEPICPPTARQAVLCQD